MKKKIGILGSTGSIGENTVSVIKNNIIDIKSDGSFRLDQNFFNYATGLTITSKKFHNLFQIITLNTVSIFR